jgi:hypothetical protein
MQAHDNRVPEAVPHESIPTGLSRLGASRSRTRRKNVPRRRRRPCVCHHLPTGSAPNTQRLMERHHCWVISQNLGV